MCIARNYYMLHRNKIMEMHDMKTAGGLLGRRGILGVIGAGICLLPLSGSLRAETFTMNPASGLWSTPTTWSPNGVPGATDSILFADNGSGTVTLNVETSRVVDTISKPGTRRWDFINNGASPATLTANTISGTTSNFIFRNSSGGLSVQAGNVNVGGGVMYFGVSANDVASYINGVTVTGTTTVSAGQLLMNVQSASTSAAYSLGLVDVSGVGIISLLNRAAGSTVSAVANTSGLVGTGGTIRATTTAGLSSLSANLVITTTANYSSATVITNGAASSAVVSLTKAGAGTQTLTGANTYTGLTTINEGTLKIGGGGATGSITSNINVTSTAAAFAIDRSDAYTFGNTISGVGQLIKMGSGTTTLTGTSSYTGGTVISDGALKMGAGTAGTAGIITGDVNISGNTAKFIIDQSIAGTFAGNISGNGSVVKTGGGTWTLGGTNSYAGGTVIENGRIRIASDANLGASNGTLTFAAGAPSSTSLEFTQSVTSSRNIIVNANTVRLSTEDVANTTTLHGVISGTGGIDKRFVGTLVLTADNTYTGSTLVSSGTLAVNGGLASTQVTVSTAGTLAGTGILAGAVTVEGNLAPGSGPGVLTINNSLTLGEAATVRFELGGASVGQFDQIAVSGALSMNGTIFLTLVGGYNPLAGTSFDLFSGWAGSMVDNGFAFDFTNAVLGEGLSWDTTDFLSTGAVSVVPEPSTWALLFCGLTAATVMGVKRRRRQATA